MLEVPIRDIICPDLINVSTLERQSLKAWIKQGQNYHFTIDITDSTFTISTYDRTNFLKPISSDINRFVRASIETSSTNCGSEISPKSISWSLVKSYYSAFYAINAILRLFGISLSYLDRNHTNKIHQISDAYSHRKGVNLKRGLYALECNSHIAEISGTLLQSNNGGAHELAWKQFLDLIGKIQVHIVSNYGSLYNSELGKLQELILNLTSSGLANGNWLSSIRNDINYQQLHGVWFPYSVSNHDRIINIMKSWNQESMSIDLRSTDVNTLSKFTATCTFIVSFCISIVKDMQNRAGDNNSFHKYGYNQILSQI